ncbi:hypothetical protein PQR65_37385 [Paraburkholderia nemoris]
MTKSIRLAAIEVAVNEGRFTVGLTSMFCTFGASTFDLMLGNRPMFGEQS